VASPHVELVNLVNVASRHEILVNVASPEGDEAHADRAGSPAAVNVTRATSIVPAARPVNVTRSWSTWSTWRRLVPAARPR
jgi:hypothetical protein